MSAKKEGENDVNKQWKNSKEFNFFKDKVNIGKSIKSIKSKEFKLFQTE